MPIQTRYIYVCNNCGRSKENDGVPDNWLLNKYSLVDYVTCPVCRLKAVKLEYERVRADAEYILEEELSNSPPIKISPMELENYSVSRITPTSHIKKEIKE